MNTMLTKEAIWNCKRFYLNDSTSEFRVYNKRLVVLKASESNSFHYLKVVTCNCRYNSTGVPTVRRIGCGMLSFTYMCRYSEQKFCLCGRTAMVYDLSSAESKKNISHGTNFLIGGEGNA